MTIPAWYEKKHVKRPLGRSREYSIKLIVEYVRFCSGCTRLDIARHLEIAKAHHLYDLLSDCQARGLIKSELDTRFYPAIFRYYLP